MRLSPQDPFMFHMQEAMADNCFAAGRYEEAIVWAEKALSGKPKSTSALLTKIASLAMLNRQVEAERSAQQYLQIDPAFRLSLLLPTMPYLNPDHRVLWLEAFRKVKMPE
jgi:tetratricopeptide (TPR) repeat protein